MKTIHVMLKPASSLCNLRCRYCFYADVSAMRSVPSCGMMSEDTVDGILAQLRPELERGDQIQFTFQGGEPMLAGLPFFRRFLARIADWDGIRTSLALQTNGILLDDDWCEFLREHKFLVGLSFDLLSQVHDGARVDAAGDGTYKQILSRISLLKRHRVDFNVLCTLTAAAARHPKQIWNQIVRLDIEYTQFTPCLAPLDGGDARYALTPQLFASFYTQLFSYWYADFRAGKRRSIKLFDDVVNLAMFGMPTSCGMTGSCQPQLVVEADGSVYPCDFYCLDEYRLGNLTVQPVSALMQAPRLQAFLQRAHHAPKLCESCRYRQFCGGNCKRMQREICCAVGDSFCGYQKFLDECGGVLFTIAAQIRQTIK